MNVFPFRPQASAEQLTRRPSSDAKIARDGHPDEGRATEASDSTALPPRQATASGTPASPLLERNTRARWRTCGDFVATQWGGIWTAISTKVDGIMQRASVEDRLQDSISLLLSTDDLVSFYRTDATESKSQTLVHKLAWDCQHLKSIEDVMHDAHEHHVQTPDVGRCIKKLIGLMVGPCGQASEARRKLGAALVKVHPDKVGPVSYGSREADEDAALLQRLLALVFDRVGDPSWREVIFPPREQLPRPPSKKRFVAAMVAMTCAVMALVIGGCRWASRGKLFLTVAHDASPSPHEGV